MADGFLDDKTWEYFWHPVCTRAELDAADTGRGKLKSVTLLGQEIVVADTATGVVAMNNRCPHRSAKLHLGWVENDAIRCPYHGWLWNGADGKCVAIPAAPDGPIPPNARAKKYSCEERYGLIWVRLRDDIETSIPRHGVFDDPSFRSVLGPSYVWKTHSARRVENYTDLAHFPFVHPETLGNAAQQTFLTPDIDFQNEGELRFKYYPAEGARSAMDAKGNLSPLKFTDYTIRLPFGVTVDLTLQNGQRAFLWVWATPIDAIHCKSFWFACRNGDLDGPDENHINTQLRILEEDVDIVESQDPEQIPHPKDEIAVGPDKVSLTYRRCLYDMCRAISKSPDDLMSYLTTGRDNI
ncbi:MAG: aromatic ring-hydroxylating dioxygenase subunit alpha [Rhodobacterales bacterium]|nr:aromatic ring-hydroxylating dioxygenase subunit alpha [Rhodobacterales bacterium]